MKILKKFKSTTFEYKKKLTKIPMKNMCVFLQELKIYKFSNKSLKKHEKINHQIRCYLNSFYKDLINYLEIAINTKKEDFIMKCLIFYENCDLTNNIWKTFYVLSKKIENFENYDLFKKVCRKIEFSELIQMNKEYLTWIYFSQENALLFIREKKPIKILVIFY